MHQQKMQLKNDELKLQRNCVIKLDRSSKNSHNAKYQCTICNYFCHTVEIALKHILGSIHIGNFETSELESVIRQLTMPNDSQLVCLSSFLVDFYQQFIVREDNLKARYDVFYKFKMKLSQIYPELDAHLYGSVASGICYGDSSCDIELKYNRHHLDLNKRKMTTSEIINAALDTIKTKLNDTFDVVSFEKSSSLDKIDTNKLTIFAQIGNGKWSQRIPFNFTSDLHPDSAYKTSILIRAYMQLDERAKILTFCFRHIARVFSSFYQLLFQNEFNFKLLFKRYQKLINRIYAHFHHTLTF
jgi:hypothetical protein